MDDCFVPSVQDRVRCCYEQTLFSFPQTKFITIAPKQAMVAWLVFCSLCLGSKMLSHTLETSQ